MALCLLVPPIAGEEPEAAPLAMTRCVVSNAALQHFLDGQAQMERPEFERALRVQLVLRQMKAAPCVPPSKLERLSTRVRPSVSTVLSIAEAIYWVQHAVTPFPRPKKPK